MAIAPRQEPSVPKSSRKAVKDPRVGTSAIGLASTRSGRATLCHVNEMNMARGWTFRSFLAGWPDCRIGSRFFFQVTFAQRLPFNPLHGRRVGLPAITTLELM